MAHARAFPPRRRSLASIVVSTLFLVTGGTGIILALWPACPLSQRLSTAFVFAQLLAFPRALGAILVAFSLCGAAVGHARACGRLRLSGYLAWTLAGIAFLAFPYGTTPHAGSPASSGTVRSLTVATFNSASTLTAADLRQLMTAAHPDVIVLPETSRHDAQRAVDAAHFSATVFGAPESGFRETHDGHIAPTSLVVGNVCGAGSPTVGPATTFGTVAITCRDPALPVLIGVHTAPPLPGLMSQWRDDLDRIVTFADSSTRSLILAGDFNATQRHGPLAASSRLSDSQAQCFPNPRGTWPARAPSFLRAPIDHVFVTGDMRAVRCRTVPIGRSDHLAYVAEISL